MKGMVTSLDPLVYRCSQRRSSEKAMCDCGDGRTVDMTVRLGGHKIDKFARPRQSTLRIISEFHAAACNAAYESLCDEPPEIIPTTIEQVDIGHINYW